MIKLKEKYQIYLKNETHAKIVFQFLESVGIRPLSRGGAYCLEDHANWSQYPYLRIHTDLSYGGNWEQQPRGTLVTLEEFIDIVEESREEECIEVELNERHTAQVFHDRVVVGCQTFPISIIAKLSEAQNKLKILK